jgi:hypothetical protein
MPKQKVKDEKHKLCACYMRLNSILDLARNACDFTSIIKPINALKEGRKYKLFTTGEKIGNVRILYYYDSDEIDQFCFYNPDEDSEEKLEMRSGASLETSDLKLYKIPLVELAKNPYIVKQDAKFEITQVQVKDFGSLVKALLSRMGGEEEGTPSVYGFFSKGVHYIGSYELFYESGTRFFAYAKVNQKDLFCSISYNYTNGTVEPSKSFSGKSHLYTRVINIADPLPFFKA